jgi:gas vesicle protein
MYASAMSTLATAVGVAFVAITTLLAAQREFAAVQSSPAYFEGTVNTTDRFVAASQAMSMFTDNSQLAVVGAKGLQSAFTTLSKVKPITGQTTAAFTSLMDVVAGSGGDLEGGSKKLAEFLAAVQKKGSLAGGAEAAKDLGPDFEKIVKEAGALGIKTSDEFLKAAAEGKLGETFATKYAGTLDALNNTVMGRFKSAISNIKSQLTEIGGQYLGDAGNAIGRLEGIVSKVITRLSYVLQSFDVSGKMGGFLDAVDKGADKFIVLMTKYLNTTPTLFQFLGDSFNTIGNAFDAMQDWMRQFQAAGELINEYFFKPLFSAIGSSFTLSMTSLAQTLESNKGAIQSFAMQIASTLSAIGKYGDVVRQLFIGAMPALQLLLKVVELFFKGLAAFGKTAMAIANAFESVFGKQVGGVIKLAALYSLFTIAKRFFTVLGTMFGKKMTGAMNVQAGVVNVNGSPVSSAGDLVDGKSGRIAKHFKEGGKFAKIGGKLKNAKTFLKTGAKQAATKLAIPLAIATGAYMAGSKIASKFNDDSVKSRGTSAAASATAGAALGATIGSVFPGVGTAAGAIIGGIVGGITGYVKAGKQRKETRKAAKTMVEDYGKSIDEAVAGGNVEDLIAMKEQLKSDRAKFVNTNADPAYAAQALKKYNEEFDKLNTKILNYTTAVGISDKYFGVGAESLNKMAEAAGIDLTAQMLTFRDVLDLVGKTAEEKARLIKVAWANIGAFAVSESMSYFDKKKQAAEAGKAVDATQQSILTGGYTEATADKFLEQLLQFNVATFGDVGGISTTFATLEKELTTGSFKDLTDVQKEYLRSEAAKAGVSAEGLLKNIDSTELATLLGGNQALDGYKNADGTLNGERIMSFITSKMTGPNADAGFLQNLIDAQQSADGSVNALQTNALLTTGTIAPNLLGATGTMSPAERNARGITGTPNAYTVPANPASNQQFLTTLNITASMLDGKTIDQIERVITKAIREQKERGSSTGTLTGSTSKNS